MGKAALDSTTAGTRRLFRQSLRAGRRARPAPQYQNTDPFDSTRRNAVFNRVALWQRLALSGATQRYFLTQQSSGRANPEVGRRAAASCEKFAAAKTAKQQQANENQAQKAGDNTTYDNGSSRSPGKLALAVVGKIGQTVCGGQTATQRD